MSEHLIGVEVAYALRERQVVVGVTLPEGSTVMDAVRASGMLEKHPEIDLGKNRLGIYGKQVKSDAVLRDRDRVEIYRPLIADPKEVRRRRAAEGRLRGGDGD